MKILAIHNRYLMKGGEDKSHLADVNLIRSKGHEVIEYIEDNSKISALGKIRTGLKTLWSAETVRNISELYVKEGFDIIHVQNFFPLVSPSLFHVASKLQVPVIQNLRNYRLLCPRADFFRNNSVCEECLNKVFPYPALKYKCYQDSFAATATIGMMLKIHKVMKTWSNHVTFYLALTEFARDKYVEGGLPASKIKVRPNFLEPDPGVGDHSGDYYLFVGRLSEEKGVRTLLKAFSSNNMNLKIIGEGPLKNEVINNITSSENIEYLGEKDSGEVLYFMKNAKALVFPSQWYEGMPRTIIEAFATGLPVISSNIGAMSTMIKHEVNGLHFKPGDEIDLIEKIDTFENEPDKFKLMSSMAREEYENNYTSSTNYELLIGIFNEAIDVVKSQK